MTSTNLAVDAIVRRLGLPARRVRAVAAYLTAAGALPSGSPGKSPELDIPDVVSLLIGSVVTVPLRAVAEAVEAYRNLGLPGHDAAGMPASVAARFHCAGSHLDVLADMAVTNCAADVSNLKIEIATSSREIAIHHVDGSVDRFMPAGVLHGHWQASGHRTSTIINGAAFVDALLDLFGRK